MDNEDALTAPPQIRGVITGSHTPNVPYPTACDECGALVVNVTLHVQWHSKLLKNTRRLSNG